MFADCTYGCVKVSQGLIFDPGEQPSGVFTPTYPFCHLVRRVFAVPAISIPAIIAYSLVPTSF